MAKDGPITRKPADETAMKVLGLESKMAPPEGWEAFFCRLADDTRPRPSAMDLTWVTLYLKRIFEHYLNTDISDDLDEEYSLGIDWCCTKTIISAACEARGIDSSAIFKADEWFEEYRRRSGIGYEWSREDLPPSWFPGPAPKMRPGEEKMTSNVKQLLFRLDSNLHAELQKDDDQGDNNSVLTPKVALRERVDMAKTATADKFRKIAEAFRAWGTLGPGNTKEHKAAAVVALTLAIENLHLINKAKDAYGFPYDALYNVPEWLGRMARPGCNLEKQVGAYNRMTQKQLPGNVSFPMVLEQWATELEKAGSVADGQAESGEGDEKKQETRTSARGASESEAEELHPPDGEWVGPMTRAEMARLVLGSKSTRWRKASSLFPEDHIIQKTDRTFLFRIDLLPEPARSRCRA
jgi:hypothetical protein